MKLSALVQWVAGNRVSKQGTASAQQRAARKSSPLATISTTDSPVLARRSCSQRWCKMEGHCAEQIESAVVRYHHPLYLFTGARCQQRTAVSRVMERKKKQQVCVSRPCWNQGRLSKTRQP